MKAIKTIVATAVIVFALTTVAMAGVQRLGGDGPDAARAQRAITPAAAHTAGAVTLSAQQSAALLHAATGARDRDRAHTPGRTPAGKRTHDRERAHADAHAATQAARGTKHGESTDTSSPHAATQTHTQAHAQTPSRSHDSGQNDSGHDGSHHGGEHD